MNCRSRSAGCRYWCAPRAPILCVCSRNATGGSSPRAKMETGNCRRSVLLTEKFENRNSKIDDGAFVNRKSKIENRESSAPPVFSLDVELLPPGPVSDVEDVRVRLECGRWLMERGDFRAEWDPERRRGWVRQTAHPYAIDSVLRILHTLLLARQGGFLVHAASAIRDGRAFLLAGPSGAGKTTLARLAPPDVALLTDEVSYVRAKEELQESEVRSQELEARSEEGGGRRQEAGVRSPSRVPRVPSAVSRIPNPEPRAPAFEAFGTRPTGHGAPDSGFGLPLPASCL